MTSFSFDDLQPQLLSDFKPNPNERGTYDSAHVFDQMITPEQLLTDQNTLQNNYMKLIFGGLPDIHDSTQAVQRAYHNIESTLQESNFMRGDIMNKDLQKFVPVGDDQTLSKDDIVQTFIDMRSHSGPTQGSSVLRGLTQWASPADTAVTYYGKNQSRFHLILGQHQVDLLGKPPPGFKPYENLSSRTFAPRENGEQVPLHIEITDDYDPRMFDDLVSLRSINSISDNVIDTGIYYGQEPELNMNFGSEFGKVL